MFFSHSKSVLGVDIGTSTIKVVQLKKDSGKIVLETYGMVNAAREMLVRQEDVIGQTADVLRNLLLEARTTTKKAVASLPNNIVFVSVIDMPQLSDKEMKSAIEWEARRYVPLPLEKVTLSWSLMQAIAPGEKVKVLLTAVPTSVINNYLRMFQLAGLEPAAFEIEALALIRALVGNRPEALILVDIGAHNTSLNLVDRGFLRVSRNLPIGGDTITAGIAQSLRVSASRAEQFKMDLGLSGNVQQIPQVMKTSLESIKNETSQLMKIYETGGEAITEIMFTGSSAYLPGLTNYFADLGVKTTLGDPLRMVEYDPRLQENLEKIGMGLSIAIGLAMRD